MAWCVFHHYSDCLRNHIVVPENFCNQLIAIDIRNFNKLEGPHYVPSYGTREGVIIYSPQQVIQIGRLAFVVVLRADLHDAIGRNAALIARDKILAHLQTNERSGEFCGMASGNFQNAGAVHQSTLN